MSTAEMHVASKSKQYHSSCGTDIEQRAPNRRVRGVMWRCKPHMLPREIVVDLLILAPHHEPAIAEAGLNTLDC
jgi:hypothetical protein